MPSGNVVVIGGGDVPRVRVGAGEPLLLIAGPCVIESAESCLEQAKVVAGIAREEGWPFVFKASFDKANRTSVESYRGPGLDEGLPILAEVRTRVGVPVLTAPLAVTLGLARRLPEPLLPDVLLLPGGLEEHPQAQEGYHEAQHHVAPDVEPPGGLLETGVREEVRSVRRRSRGDRRCSPRSRGTCDGRSSRSSVRSGGSRRGGRAGP